MQDAYVYYVSRPRRLRTGGYQFEVASLSLQVHGPFGTYAEAEAARRRLRSRWAGRALALGGTLTDNGTEWIVSVPPGTPVRGLPWKPGDPVEPPKGRDPRDDPPLKLRSRGWKIT